MVGRPANDEMIQGYQDGLDADCPEPSGNRSHSYRHGFENGRADRAHKPSGNYTERCQQANEAMAADEAEAIGAYQ